jgi:F-type H+-transporting ATPase subunit delta
MTQTTAADVVQAVLELSKKNGGKAMLRDVIAALQKEVAGEGTIAVTLTTPTGDAGEMATSVAQVIEKKFGRPVLVTQKKNPSLIGGVILQFGDERMDLSVRGALEQFEQTLRTNVLPN